MAEATWFFPAKKKDYEGLPTFAALPAYEYRLGQLACPECYAPVARNREDGRCDRCLHSEVILEVNYLREKEKPAEED